VDPFSIDSIKEAMLSIYRDSALRDNLIEKGNMRKLKFSWDITANRVWESIEKTLRG